MNRTNLYKLASMPYAQCTVEIEINEAGNIVSVTLVSYRTTVITICFNHVDKWATLFCTGTYSTTTARHINRFTREFCGENLYHTCKRTARKEHIQGSYETMLSRAEWYINNAERKYKYL